MEERIYNFNPGPAVLPLPVLEEVRDNLLNYQGTGLGIMEMSHRGGAFKKIIEGAEADLRSLLSIPENYAVIFATGGATNQFSMVPMNLLRPGEQANYIISGSWAKKASEEAGKFGEVHLAASSKEEGFKRIPREISLSAQPSYLHFTSNNTIVGSQFLSEPVVPATDVPVSDLPVSGACRCPLVCDASSDALSRPLDVVKYGLIYAGAQKNLGPAGVTLVVVRKDILERCPAGLPVMMDYRTYSEHGSLYNTPPTLPIYVVGLVLKWLLKIGGLAEIKRRNEEKAALLYECIDRSGFYQAVVEKESRSRMNITFRLPSEDLEAQFVKAAEGSGFSGLKGHRSVGGIRASVYNAFPCEGVRALCSFMEEFERTKG